MFKSGNKKQGDEFHPNSITLLAEGCVITGDIHCKNGMRIDGTIKGNVQCDAKIILGEHGKIEGDLKAESADLRGLLQGDAHISGQLCLKSGCVVNGNLYAANLQIEPRAAFNGECKMLPAKEEKAPLLLERVA